MKMMILVSLVISSTALAAKIEDIQILEVAPQNSGLQLKLKIEDRSRKTYFFLEVTKDDPESFNKMTHLIQKMANPRSYRLNMNIPSFSFYPSGSYYRSNDVTFYEFDRRAPTSLELPKKKKK